MQAAHVEVAYRLAGADPRHVLEEERKVTFGHGRVDATDRFLRGEAEDLRRARVPGADTAVELEVHDRDRRGVDQRAMVLIGVLDLLELRRLLQRGRRLVRERAQDLQ